MQNNNFSSLVEKAKAIAAKLKQDTNKRKGEGEEVVTSVKKYKPLTITETIEIPSHYATLVTGRSGEGLKNIELSCNCRIEVDDEVVNDKRRVTIKGEPLSVKEAKDKIDRIVYGEGALQILTGEQSSLGYQTIFVQVPTSRVGLVIGKGGETIRALQEKTGARINLCKDGEMDNPPNAKTVVVYGPPHCIAMAQQYIDDIVSGNSYAGTFAITGDSETMYVPKEKVGQVIGKGGETIKYIQNTFNVKLTIDSKVEVNGERPVTITGSLEAIKNAKEEINEKVWGNKRGMLGDADDYGVKMDKEYAQIDPAYSAAYGMGVPAAYSSNVDYAAMMGYDKETWEKYVEYYAQYYATLQYPTDESAAAPGGGGDAGPSTLS
jgi:rRNA processing protein Krr1/Pno1